MMSILIKGMEMPTSCFECKLLDYTDTYKCRVRFESLAKEHGINISRPDWCPLVSVPPHGKLIDADALLERFEKEEKAADEHGRDFSFSFKSGGENCTEWWPVQVMLMDAPTVIPADPSVEEAKIQSEFLQNWHEEGET